MPEINPNSDRLSMLPPPVQEAYRHFQAEGDPKSFRLVLHHVMTDFKPDIAAKDPADLTDNAHLVEDLGYDSLALTEMVFFFEDLFGVAITNSELRSLTTVGDLRRFVLEKIRAA